jgi:hypothetical protein
VHVTLEPLIEHGEPLAPRLTSVKIGVAGAVPFTAVTNSAIDFVFAEKYDAAVRFMLELWLVPAVTASEIVILAVPVGEADPLGIADGVAVGEAVAAGAAGAGVSRAPPPPHPAPANISAAKNRRMSERANVMPRLFMPPR